MLNQIIFLKINFIAQYLYLTHSIKLNLKVHEGQIRAMGGKDRDKRELNQTTNKQTKM